MTIGIFKSWIKQKSVHNLRSRIQIKNRRQYPKRGIYSHGVTKRKCKKDKFSVAENSDLPSQCGSGSRKPNQCGSKRIPIPVRQKVEFLDEKYT
jgi:hypothetical protein